MPTLGDGAKKIGRYRLCSAGQTWWRRRAAS